MLPLDDIPLPGWHSVSNVAAAVAVGALLGVPADAIRAGRRRASAASSTAWSRSRRSMACASSTTPRAPNRTRSSPRCAASRRRWCSSAAAASKGLAMDDAGARGRGAGHGRGAHRRERPGAGCRVPGRRPGTHASRAGSMDEAVTLADRIARDAPGDPGDAGSPRPCCSARPRRASTCSPTTRPGAVTSSARWPALGRRAMTVNARPGPRRSCPYLPRPPPRSCATAPLDPDVATVRCGAPPRTAPQASGDRRRQASPRSAVGGAGSGRCGRPRPSARDIAAGRTVKGPVRERHEADPGVIIATVALAAMGVLMIYSAGAASLSRRPGATCPGPIAPELVWVTLGIVVMLVLSRMDYRWLRLVSVPLFLGAIGLLVLVLGPAIGPISPIEVSDAARWLNDRRRCSSSIPRRSPSWRSSSTSPTGWPGAAPASAGCSRARCRSCASPAASSRWSRSSPTWARRVSSRSPPSRCSSWPAPACGSWR